MSERSAMEATLKLGGLVDSGGLLKAGGQRELERELAWCRERGRPAGVLLLPRGESLEPWRGLWDDLDLDERNLLLLFNGRRWEARGWGLTPGEITQRLERAKPDLRIYYARGLVTALRFLAEETESTVSPQTEDDELPLLLPLSGGALVLLAGAGLAAFAIRRRMERERREREELREALSEARQAFAEVIFGGDELALSEPREAERLQLQASELSDRLDALEREVEGPALDASPAVLLGRVRQIQNELRVLTSTVLQRSRGGSLEERSQGNAQEPDQDRPAER